MDAEKELIESTPSSYSQNLSINSAKPRSNRTFGLLVILIILQTITLGIAGYFSYQYYQIKRQATLPPSNPASASNTIPTSSSTPSSKYTYITPEEYKQKMIAFLIDVNKNDKNFQVDKVAELVESAVKEYKNLDEFTKSLISLCPSSFSSKKSGYYTPLEDISKLPFIVKGSYKISCVTDLFSPRLSNLKVDIPVTDFEVPIESVHVFVTGYKSASEGTDEYSISTPDVLKRIDQLPTINGANVEVKNKELVNNDTGKLDSYLTFLYAYKKTPDFLVSGIVSIKEKSNENFINSRLDQYPNIDSGYKIILDQLTEIITSIESR